MWCLVNLARNQNSLEINLFIILKQDFINHRYIPCMCTYIMHVCTSLEYDIVQCNATLPFGVTIKKGPPILQEREITWMANVQLT